MQVFEPVPTADADTSVSPLWVIEAAEKLERPWTPKPLLQQLLKTNVHNYALDQQCVVIDAEFTTTKTQFIITEIAGFGTNFNVHIVKPKAAQVKEFLQSLRPFEIIFYKGGTIECSLVKKHVPELLNRMCNLENYGVIPVPRKLDDYIHVNHNSIDECEFYYWLQTSSHLPDATTVKLVPITYSLCQRGRKIVSALDLNNSHYCAAFALGNAILEKHGVYAHTYDIIDIMNAVDNIGLYDDFVAEYRLYGKHSLSTINSLGINIEEYSIDANHAKWHLHYEEKKPQTIFAIIPTGLYHSENDDMKIGAKRLTFCPGIAYRLAQWMDTLHGDDTTYSALMSMHINPKHLAAFHPAYLVRTHEIELDVPEGNAEVIKYLRSAYSDKQKDMFPVPNWASLEEIKYVLVQSARLPPCDIPQYNGNDDQHLLIQSWPGLSDITTLAGLHNFSINGILDKNGPNICLNEGYTYEFVPEEQMQERKTWTVKKTADTETWSPPADGFCGYYVIYLIDCLLGLQQYGCTHNEIISGVSVTSFQTSDTWDAILAITKNCYDLDFTQANILQATAQPKIEQLNVLYTSKFALSIVGTTASHASLICPINTLSVTNLIWRELDCVSDFPVLPVRCLIGPSKLLRVTQLELLFSNIASKIKKNIDVAYPEVSDTGALMRKHMYVNGGTQDTFFIMTEFRDGNIIMHLSKERQDHNVIPKSSAKVVPAKPVGDPNAKPAAMSKPSWARICEKERPCKQKLVTVDHGLKVIDCSTEEEDHLQLSIGTSLDIHLRSSDLAEALPKQYQSQFHRQFATLKAVVKTPYPHPTLRYLNDFLYTATWLRILTEYDVGGLEVCDVGSKWHRLSNFLSPQPRVTYHAIRAKIFPYDLEYHDQHPFESFEEDCAISHLVQPVLHEQSLNAELAVIPSQVIIMNETNYYPGCTEYLEKFLSDDNTREAYVIVSIYLRSGIHKLINDEGTWERTETQIICRPNGNPNPYISPIWMPHLKSADSFTHHGVYYHLCCKVPTSSQSWQCMFKCKRISDNSRDDYICPAEPKPDFYGAAMHYCVHRGIPEEPTVSDLIKTVRHITIQNQTALKNIEYSAAEEMTESAIKAIDDYRRMRLLGEDELEKLKDTAPICQLDSWALDYPAVSYSFAKKQHNRIAIAFQACFNFGLFYAVASSSGILMIILLTLIPGISSLVGVLGFVVIAIPFLYSILGVTLDYLVTRYNLQIINEGQMYEPFHTWIFKWFFEYPLTTLALHIPFTSELAQRYLARQVINWMPKQAGDDINLFSKYLLFVGIEGSKQVRSMVRKIIEAAEPNQQAMLRKALDDMLKSGEDAEIFATPQTTGGKPLFLQRIAGQMSKAPLRSMLHRQEYARVRTRAIDSISSEEKEFYKLLKLKEPILYEKMRDESLEEAYDVLRRQDNLMSYLHDHAYVHWNLYKKATLSLVQGRNYLKNMYCIVSSAIGTDGLEYYHNWSQMLDKFCSYQAQEYYVIYAPRAISFMNYHSLAVVYYVYSILYYACVWISYYITRFLVSLPMPDTIDVLLYPFFQNLPVVVVSLGLLKNNTSARTLLWKFRSFAFISRHLEHFCTEDKDMTTSELLCLPWQLSFNYHVGPAAVYTKLEKWVADQQAINTIRPTIQSQWACKQAWHKVFLNAQVGGEISYSGEDDEIPCHKIHPLIYNAITAPCSRTLVADYFWEGAKTTFSNLKKKMWIVQTAARTAIRTGYRHNKKNINCVDHQNSEAFASLFSRHCSTKIEADPEMLTEFKMFARRKIDELFRSNDRHNWKYMSPEEYLDTIESARKPIYTKGYELGQRGVFKSVFEVMSKGDEVNFKEEFENRARNLFNPCELIKMYGGFLNTNALEFLNAVIGPEANFDGRKSNGMFIYGLNTAGLEDALTKLSLINPSLTLGLATDGSAHDAHQRSQLLEAVDCYFWEKFMVEIHQYWQDNPHCFAYMSNFLQQTSYKIKMNSAGRMNEQQKVVSGTIYGTTFTGSPTLTTFGNSLRVLLYHQFIAERANVKINVAVSGDDSFFLIDPKDLKTFTDVFFQVYAAKEPKITTFHGLAQVAKMIEVCGRSINFLSKVGYITAVNTVHVHRSPQRFVFGGCSSFKIGDTFTKADHAQSILDGLYSSGRHLPWLSEKFWTQRQKYAEGSSRQRIIARQAKVKKDYRVLLHDNPHDSAEHWEAMHDWTQIFEEYSQNPYDEEVITRFKYRTDLANCIRSSGHSPASSASLPSP